MHSLNKNKISKNFNKAAISYDAHAHLQIEVGKRLIERLKFLKIKPKKILDLGSGTGVVTKLLKTLYPSAEIICLDLAYNMLRFAKDNDRGDYFICGDAESLPIKANSFDLIFSNCTIQWLSDFNHAFLSLEKLLSPNGYLIFSTFGPDTLYEIKQAMVEDSFYTNLVDMHFLGDMLQKNNYNTPIVDSENITVTYKTVMGLLKDLKAIGANYSNQSRRGLLTKTKLDKIVKNYNEFLTADNVYPATYEIIYGMANKKQQYDPASLIANFQKN